MSGGKLTAEELAEAKSLLDKCSKWLKTHSGTIIGNNEGLGLCGWFYAAMDHIAALEAELALARQVVEAAREAPHWSESEVYKMLHGQDKLAAAIKAYDALKKP